MNGNAYSKEISRFSISKILVKHTLQKNTRESFWSLVRLVKNWIFYGVLQGNFQDSVNLLLEMALGLISGLLELFIVRMIGLLKLTSVLFSSVAN